MINDDIRIGALIVFTAMSSMFGAYLVSFMSFLCLLYLLENYEK